MEPTLRRARMAYRASLFDLIPRKKLVIPVSDDFLKVLKAGGTSTNVRLRILHDTALKLGWLLRRVLAEAAWPEVKYGITRAITLNEHQKIMPKEQNPERARYRYHYGPGLV